ncbi:RHS repeat domain-containing protein [Geosporobacter ferrireducens]|uniref:Teneurin-like YD-shell domain-containing protein n=1 Tax=Geosporobacter ferrireducens TaxID=1424294 RepID=A0A1D8GBN9_9FIRM|nr:RHS repeat-associated core domain-containing protein [Geosporobacter ferrireducens]AOT68322.1 hypothetical protein Gferi_01180 [Geosporobacter ferrireducens]
MSRIKKYISMAVIAAMMVTTVFANPFTAYADQKQDIENPQELSGEKQPNNEALEQNTEEEEGKAHEEPLKPVEEETQEQEKASMREMNVAYQAAAAASYDPYGIKFDEYFNSPFKLSRQDAEEINMVTGALHYQMPLFHLPGKNGMNLNLNLRYESDEATLHTHQTGVSNTGENLYAVRVDESYNVKDRNGNIVDNYRKRYTLDKKYTNSYDAWKRADELNSRPLPENCTDRYYSVERFFEYYDKPGNSNSYAMERYNLGAGWFFNLTSIQMLTEEEVSQSNRSKYMVLHLGNGEKINIKKTLEGSNYDRVAMRTLTPYEDYSVEYDGSGIYTNGQKPSMYILSHIDGKKAYFAADGRLLGIKDAFGNEIRFKHTMINNKPFINEIIDTYGRTVSINYNTSSKTATITLPDNTTIQLKSAAQGNATVLKEVVDPKGNSTKLDEYAIDTASFLRNVWANDRDYPETKTYVLLKNITHATGAKTQYEYIKGTKRNTDVISQSSCSPYEEYFKISRRYERLANQIYNDEAITYENDYTGYPEFAHYDKPLKSFRHYTRITDSNGLVRRLTFDNENLLRAEDYLVNSQLQKTIERDYDSLKQPSRETIKTYDSSGAFSLKEKAYKYNPYKQLEEYTDELGHASKTIYQPENQSLIRQEILPVDTGKEQIITYEISEDKKYNKTKTIQYKTVDGTAKTIKTEYLRNPDGTLQRTSLTMEDNSILTTLFNYEYGVLNREGNKINRVTSITNTTYLNWGADKAVTQAKENTIEKTEYQFSTGQTIKYIAPDEKYEAYKYDPLGRLVEYTNFDGTKKTINYDDIRNILITTDEDGLALRNTYDGLGNEITLEEGYIKPGQTTYTFSVKTKKTYNNQSLLKTLTDGNNNTTTYDYDPYGRMIKTVNSDTTYTQTLYDDKNLMVAHKNEEGHILLKEYFDKRGQKIKEEALQTTGEILTTQYTYDHAGNLKTQKDPKGNLTNYQYDELSRLIKTSNAKQEATKYYYNHQNSLIKIQFPDGKTKQKTYDELGRIIKETDETGKNQYIRYNQNGTIDKIQDREKQDQKFTYTANGQIKTHAGQGFNITYQYHRNGRIQSVSDTAYGTVSYEYDDIGRLHKEINPGNKQTTYTYDPNGNLQTIQDPFGTLTKYNYDKRNRIDTIQINGKTFDYDYYTDGMMRTLKYPVLNNQQLLQTDYTFDNLNRLSSITNKIGTKSISDYNYTYDSNSNIKTITGIDGNHQYSYDELNRLKSLQRYNQSIQTTFEYDPRGNRTKATGDMDALLSSGKEGSFTWDGLNRLRKFTNSQTGQEETYTYDYKGIRKKKQTPKGTTHYYTDQAGRVIAEADGNGNLKASIIWGHKPLARIEQGKWYYYVYNGHGDVVQLVDENGNIVNRYTYDEWGNLLASDETIENPIRYAGEYYDEETGLYYLRARYYDPTIGRFISKDSYEGAVTNPLSMNQYIYCMNNPLVYVDPSGNIPEKTRAYLMGLIHAIDDGFFFGAASKLTGNTPAGWQNSSYAKEFNETYTAGKITNQIYGLVNISSGLKDLISKGKFVINSAGELVSVGTGEVVGVFKTVKGTIVFSLSNKGASNGADFKFPKSNNDMKKIFGVNDKTYHKEIKPKILKQIKQDSVYGKEFKKMGNNPDIGIDSAGNIVLKDVKTGKTLPTNWSFESFKP